MTFEELLQTQTAPAQPLLRALWLARRGDWAGAHDLVGEFEGREAARLHAHLHRVEGNLSNARYWYGVARVAPHEGSLAEEWEEIARALTRAAS